MEAYYNVLTHTTPLITDTIIITHVYSITGPTHTHTIAIYYKSDVCNRDSNYRTYSTNKPLTLL